MKASGFALALALCTVAPQVFAQVEEEVQINIAPPAPQVEVRSTQPSPQHVWVGGHWLWNRFTNSYQWHPGFWQVPAVQGQVWQPAQWVQFNGFWRFVPGHWRTVNEVVVPPIQLVRVQMAPPPPQVETIRPPQPSPQHVWIGGHWFWNGQRYVWQGGHWDIVVNGRAWVPGHWYNNNGFWFFAPGHWQWN